MSAKNVSVVRLVSYAAAALIGVGAAYFHTTPAPAQCKGGEFVLRQANTVGWVCVNSDRTVEWWAYIDGVYEWADPANTSQNLWNLTGEYVGDGSWPSYSAWKSDVLSRAAATGHTVVFQQHSCTEETVEN